MPMKEQQRSAYRSMQGKTVDMHKLIKENEMTVAVGNMKVNARGDELGEGGRIVRTREQLQKAVPTQQASRTPAKLPEAKKPAAGPVSKKLKNLANHDPEGNE
jgi:hypothetical protein